MALFGILTKNKKDNLNEGLSKTKESLFKKLGRVVAVILNVDDCVQDYLDDALISSDVGGYTSLYLFD